MKKILSLALVAFTAISFIVAQPQKMTYQTVVRDVNNELVANQQIGLKISIFEDNANGPLVYSETHTANTNANGLVSVIVGMGIHAYPTSLADVQWGEHDHYLRVDIDPTGGVNYTITGTTQLLTVPYAFYAGSVRHADTALYLKNFSDTVKYAIHSDTANYAYNAGNANYATSAGNANYADSTRITNYANNAGNANYATSAGNANYADSTRITNYANNAGNANYATSAGNANYADSTRITNYANNAGNASFAMNAQYSDTARTSHFADTTSVSNYAHNAGNANYATSAGNANYADSTRITNTALYADSSNYNHLSNRPKGTNKGDILYWETIDSSWHIVPVGNIGQTLTLDSNYVPHWDSISCPVTTYTLPIVVTNSISNSDYTGSTANVSGYVTNGGGTAFVVNGFCWAKTVDPTISNPYSIDGLGINTTFSHQITGLDTGTTYHVRAFSMNNAGVGYGQDRTFKTWGRPVVMTVGPAISITQNSAYCGGNVTSDGGTSLTARGVCWGTSNPPYLSSNNYSTGGYSTGTYTHYISNLAMGTTYYVRAYATNSIGTSYGSTVFSFKTLNKPTVSTDQIVTYDTNSAVVRGTVSDSGGVSVTERGLVWHTSSNPSISNNIGFTNNGTGIGTFNDTMTNLIPGQKYYVRAYARNSIGYSYGTTMSFTTINTFVCGSHTIVDYDNNVYQTVQIGTQCWMKENMRTTHYPDGTPIDDGTGQDTSSTIGYFYHADNICSCNNDSIFGLLYNWPAAMNYSTIAGSQGICPKGWHVPRNNDFSTLRNTFDYDPTYYCGGYPGYGKISKVLASKNYWNSYSSDTCATGYLPQLNDASGFSAKPAGCYTIQHKFAGQLAAFWESTNTWYNYNSPSVPIHVMGNFSSMQYRSGYFQGSGSCCSDYQRISAGLSVRCVKD